VCGCVCANHRQNMHCTDRGQACMSCLHYSYLHNTNASIAAALFISHPLHTSYRNCDLQHVHRSCPNPLSYTCHPFMIHTLANQQLAFHSLVPLHDPIHFSTGDSPMHLLLVTPSCTCRQKLSFTCATHCDARTDR
jgi:hypothetical protein